MLFADDNTQKGDTLSDPENHLEHLQQALKSKGVDLLNPPANGGIWARLDWLNFGHQDKHGDIIHTSLDTMLEAMLIENITSHAYKVIQKLKETIDLY